ncbi:MAG: hypothetical protein C0404_02950 [Verrucomicrobia bacterium]|nr:hypothetical protein [Verrucomicrobiota bacterium]
MAIVADTHVHLYKCYDLNLAFSELFRNLDRRAAEAGSVVQSRAVKAAFLAERQDCDFFENLENGRLDGQLGEFKVDRIAGHGCMRITAKDDQLFLFAGRQSSTLERIEVLGLAMSGTVPDGLTAFDTIRRIKDLGGVPVVAWAFGKWLFGRGKVVRRLVDAFKAGEILLGDSSMRPAIWPEPGLMKLARRKGIAVVAGSDPLPFAGEEQMMASCATIFDANLDTLHPLVSARAILAGVGSMPAVSGGRAGVLDVLRRRRGAGAKKT